MTSFGGSTSYQKKLNEGKYVNHFLDIHTLSYKDLRAILDRAHALKNSQKSGDAKPFLAGKQLAMIFEKPSTRTRVSFQVGISQLGGNAVLLDSQTSQLGRGETIADSARVLSRYVDLIMIRCFAHKTLLALAKYATVPVINGLTDASHPCQILADIQTIEEHRGAIEGKTVAWIGDGNNVCHSWIHAAAQLKFRLQIATPEGLKPSADVLAWAKAQNADVHLTHDPKQAVKDAIAVNTDCWVSMGDKDADQRHKMLAPYQVTESLMGLAAKDALFLHCLPAHRGEEMTDGVIDGPQSVIFDEAENRLHAQKAVMLWCAGR
jgi:ornithine carbamoyltransferase